MYARSSTRARRAVQSVVIAAVAIAGVAIAAPAADASVKVTVRNGELVVDGSNQVDALALRLSATDPSRLDVDLGADGSPDFNVDRNTFERIAVKLRGGTDLLQIDDANGAFTDTEITTLDTGAGDDVINGGLGAETIRSGSGNDAVDGGRGNDTVNLGSGTDRFQWDPGEGSDVVDGRSGSDVMVFNGSNGDERFEALPNGRLVRFTRDAGNIVMDLDNIEEIDLDAFDGRDTLVVRDMAGTDLDVLNTDLENAAGSGIGDALTDFITVFGTDGDDDVTVSGAAGTTTVTGLTTTVNITRAVLPDVMQVLALGGNDTIDASGLAADAIGYGTSGSDGNDTLLGGAGADSLDGGNGNDFVDGGRGDDSVFTGSADDVFQWDPGEGSDLFGGEDGYDTMLFNGSNQNEAFATFADGFGGATFTRDVGNITMSLDRVEQIDLAARGGADTLLVDDLSHFRGTGIEAINSDLGSDGLADVVTVTGSESDDVIGVTGAPGTANVTGLAATVGITGLEPIDRLEVNGLDGNDTIDATPLPAGILSFRANGATGDDTLLGSEGDDVLDGGSGDDVLIGGAGDDVLLNGEVVSDD